MDHRTVLKRLALASLVSLAVACAGEPAALDDDPGEPRIREEHPISSPREPVAEPEPAAEETAIDPGSEGPIPELSATVPDGGSEGQHDR